MKYRVAVVLVVVGLGLSGREIAPRIRSQEYIPLSLKTECNAYKSGGDRNGSAVTLSIGRKKLLQISYIGYDLGDNLAVTSITYKISTFSGASLVKEPMKLGLVNDAGGVAKTITWEKMRDYSIIDTMRRGEYKFLMGFNFALKDRRCRVYIYFPNWVRTSYSQCKEGTGCYVLTIAGESSPLGQGSNPWSWLERCQAEVCDFFMEAEQSWDIDEYGGSAYDSSFRVWLPYAGPEVSPRRYITEPKEMPKP
jgi:hypothetical protein